MVTSLIVMFLLGIVNFALHRAVMESGHPLLRQMPQAVQARGGRISLIAEFLVLLAAMLSVANGWPSLVWAYGIYSAINVGSAWLILNGRM